MRKLKTPPTTLELLEKFKVKCPNLPEAVYQQVHDSIIEARVTVSLAKAEFELANQNKQQEDDSGM